MRAAKRVIVREIALDVARKIDPNKIKRLIFEDPNKTTLPTANNLKLLTLLRRLLIKY